MKISVFDSEKKWVALSGTAHQIAVSAVSGGAITLSLPQDIDTTSSPTFAGMTVGTGSAKITINTTGITATRTVSFPNSSGTVAYQSLFGSNLGELDENGSPAWQTVSIRDLIDGHRLQFTIAADLTADRAISIVTGNASRVLTFTADASIGGVNTGDQTSVSGNAGTATALATARSIYGNSFNGTADLTAAIAPNFGGTGQSTYTNGQLLIGNTTGNTLTKSTLTGTANQVIVTNGTGSITLSLPQSIATTSTPQFAKIGVNAAAHATAKIYTTDSSSNTILVETTAATGQAGLQCALKNGGSAVRTFSFSTRGDLDASGTFNIADETAGAIRMSVDQNGWFGFGGTGLSRLHAIENAATASERGIISEQFLNGTTGGTFIGRKARVSGSSRISINSADILAEFKAQGHDGTSFVDAGKIQVISTGTIGTGRMPSDMVFYTSTDVSTSVVTEAMRLTAAQKMALAGQVSKYNGITTAGGGVPAIYGQGRFTAQTAAKASVATYTVGAADASFLVWANVLVTTATTHSFTVTCAYTDEGNTARTLTLSFSLVAGGAMTTTIANAGGAVPYSGIPIAIRCKASTSITIATTGTFTTVTYNVEGYIGQVS